MYPLGFSTGAIAFGDFRSALSSLAHCNLPCVELSALRVWEVKPLIDAIPNLDLSHYQYVSLHAPSRFSVNEEIWLVEQLTKYVPKAWPIVLHPDAIHEFDRWKSFGRRLAIENMDRRKECGRTVIELKSIFKRLPEAGLCFDIGHSRQYDPSMTEAFFTLREFADRILQVHLSEVNSESQHESLSYGAKIAFQQVAELIAIDTPIIVESRVEQIGIETEIRSVEQALTPARSFVTV